jgi:transcriptional regulator with XRE-family HTH domain
VVLPDELHRRFGETLRDLRMEKGLSQEQLAHQSELTRNYVSDLERGRKSPSLRTIARIAKTLGIPPHALLKQAEDTTSA